MWRIIFFILLNVGAVVGLMAQTTKVTIRALAKDAKFIGTGIGGAYVTIKNHYTQELLAKGYTVGTSGDTKIVVTDPKVRYNRITDDNTAKFVGELNITEPTFVDIEVIAPFSRRNAAIKSSTQIWVIPEKHILDDGIILEIPGFIVDILSPHTHEVISFGGDTKEELTLKVHLVMMCGCVVQQGGLWDSENYDVTAIVRKEGDEITKVSLVKASEDNIFEASIPIEEKGNYEIVVTAFDNKAHNTGVDKINFVVK
jgi:hypothetical protein